MEGSIDPDVIIGKVEQYFHETAEAWDSACTSQLEAEYRLKLAESLVLIVMHCSYWMSRPWVGA